MYHYYLLGFSLICFMCVFCMFVCVPCECLLSVEEVRVLDSPGMGITDGCEPPCWYRKLSLGPLQDEKLPLSTRQTL